MSSYLISMFIDDELDLDEKIQFVEKVYEDRQFKEEAVDLLYQDKLLRDDMVERVPEIQVSLPKRYSLKWLRPVAAFSAALAMAAVFLFLVPRPVMRLDAPTAELTPHRFVLYLPKAAHAQIVGSFTHWRPVPMQKLEKSGYWVLTLDLPKGEHRYSYLVENKKRLADPTVLAREKDDFGGENSIIEVKKVI